MATSTAVESISSAPRRGGFRFWGVKRQLQSIYGGTVCLAFVVMIVLTAVGVNTRPNTNHRHRPPLFGGSQTFFLMQAFLMRDTVITQSAIQLGYQIVQNNHLVLRDASATFSAKVELGTQAFIW